MSGRAIRAGELFVLGFKGAALPGWLARFAARFGLGGVILFDVDRATGRPGNNIDSPEQLRALCAELSALPSGPLIFIDQEGGRVRRLKPERGFAPLPSQARFARLPRAERMALARASYGELKALGIHFNLAPVIDLNSNPDNPDIGAVERSYSADPAEVAENARLVDAVAREVHLGLCLKHYPGLGGAREDSHREIADLGDTPTEAQLELFYRLGGEISGGAILVSHAIVAQWEPGIPVSASPVAIGALRRRLPAALLISDDLQMAGLRKLMDPGAAVVRGLRAGLDLLLIGNNLLDEQAAMEPLAAAMEAAIAVKPELHERYATARARIDARKRRFRTG